MRDLSEAIRKIPCMNVPGTWDMPPLIVNNRPNIDYNNIVITQPLGKVVQFNLLEFLKGAKGGFQVCNVDRKSVV
jgi:hypothetical protein